MKNFNKILILPAASAFLGCFSAASLAAPGVLSDKPLFLGTDVQPNILWLVDDSGSMDWEVLLSKEAISEHDEDDKPENDDDAYYLDFESPSDNREKRELCSAYNVMAYDPSPDVSYEPWSGVDSDGNAYGNSSVSAARKNPYLSNASTYNDSYDQGGNSENRRNDGRENNDSGYDNTTNVQDLRDHYYYPWTDTDIDGLYDSGECDTSDANRVRVGTLSVENQQKYANWFSYYRKREFVAKKALSSIVSDSQARMGLATLHNNRSVGTKIEDIDNLSTPLNATAATNKNALLEHLFEIHSSNGTPLRETLEQAGDYFKAATDPGSGLFGFNPSPNSPILSQALGGECQQNFTILMSDGYGNGSDPSVGNADADTTNEFDGGSYADIYSNSLADVAMHYYKNDLSPLADRVPETPGVDENSAQHMVTYTVAFGVNGTLDAGPDADATSFLWPQRAANTSTTIDDMRHAAWNGRGLFLNAAKPDALIESLSNAISDIADREGAASAVAFNSTSLEADTFIFQARFDSDRWSGDLDALSFVYDADGNIVKDADTGKSRIIQRWSAADELNARDLAAQPRQIVTYNGTTGVPFAIPVDYKNPTAAELASAQLQDLLKDAPNTYSTVDTTEISENQTYGASIVAYLRGDNTVTSFRDRGGDRLGDIVHSSPEFVAAPDTPYPNLIEGAANKYSDFVALKESRTALVYVGSNDGMLHAFNAVSGSEHFAYIPGLLYSSDSQAGLHYLARDTYSHIPYVDESPLAADIFVDSQWRTYLVGALRAGGKGVYVLDVTDPTSLTEASASSVVKQEFTHSDLGYTFSRPLVGKMNNGRWAAIFGNGYNSSGDGRGKLFILYLDSTGGFDLIDTGVGSIVSNDCNNASSDCSGVSSPTVLDLDGNGTVDRIYAGDIQGNIWAFNVSQSVANDWAVAHTDSDDNIVPLFSACSASPCTASNRQPVTSLSVVKTHPNRRSNSTEPNLMVYFGTGQYLAADDNLSTASQAMYGVWDTSVGELDRSDLQAQTITDAASVSGGRDITTNAVDYAVGSEYGWFINLPDTGERIVVEPVVVGDIVFFNTMVPEGVICSPGGYGYLMFADRMSGGQPDFTVLDFDNDGVYDDTIMGGMKLTAIPGGGRLIDDKLVVSDSSGAITDFGVQTNESRRSSRSSWSIFK